MVIDQHRAGELLAAVDHAVTDRVDLGHRGDNAVFRAGQLVDNGGNGFGMRRERKILVEDGLSADQRAVLEVPADADALAEALGKNLFGFHIDQLVFQGRAACVDHKNFHVAFSFLFRSQKASRDAWISHIF